jgi:hypothetical protein
MVDERRLEDTVDHSEIRRLQDAYADIVSRRKWDELSDIFLPDTELELDLRDRTIREVGPEAISRFIDTMVSQFEFFQFGILGTRIHLRSGGDPDRAAGRMYMTELRQTPAGQWSQIYGMYHDRYRRVGGRWWFAHRLYHSLARNNMPAAVFPYPDHISLPDF